MIKLPEAPYINKLCSRAQVDGLYFGLVNWAYANSIVILKISPWTAV